MNDRLISVLEVPLDRIEANNGQLLGAEIASHYQKTIYESYGRGKPFMIQLNGPLPLKKKDGSGKYIVLRWTTETWIDTDKPSAKIGRVLVIRGNVVEWFEYDIRIMVTT